MSDLRELYQEVIIEHGRQPRHFGALESANRYKEGFNPLCGDKITIHVYEESGIIKDMRFEGCGCAISIASASLMIEALIGKSTTEMDGLFDDFHRWVTETDSSEALEERLGKLAVLGGVREFPARVKCATLAWHTLKAALSGDPESVRTE